MGSKNTAIARKGPSAPLKYILGAGVISPGPVIDYGCGKGADARHLNEIGISADSYDPHWNPISLEGMESSYKTIFCTYVFNVIEQDKEDFLIYNLNSLLASGGAAYISVRRDIKKEGKTSRGFQRNVFLDLPIVKEYRNNYCIYKLTKNMGPK